MSKIAVYHAFMISFYESDEYLNFLTVSVDLLTVKVRARFKFKIHGKCLFAKCTYYTKLLFCFSTVVNNILIRDFSIGRVFTENSKLSLKLLI